MKTIKKNLYIIFAIAFLVISIAVSAVIVILNVNVPDASTTSIGHIYIGNAKGEEREKIIDTAFNQWVTDTKNAGGYSIKYQNKSYQVIPSDYWDINKTATISGIVEGKTDNRIYLMPNSIGDTNQLKIDIERALLGGTLTHIEQDRLFEKIQSIAGELYSSYTIDLYEYLVNYELDNKILDNKIGVSSRYDNVALVSLDVTDYLSEARKIVEELPEQSHTVEIRIAGKFERNETYTYKGIKLQSGNNSEFSLLDFTANNAKGLGSKELSILGTGLASIAVQSNLTNVRCVTDVRQLGYSYKGFTTVVDDEHNVVDSQTNNYGLAVSISRPNNQDLSFYNSDSFDYTVAVDLTGNTLSFVLIGPKSVNNYTITSKIDAISNGLSVVDASGQFSLESQDDLDAAKINLSKQGYEDLSRDNAFLADYEQIASKFDPTTQELYVKVDQGREGSLIYYYKNYEKEEIIIDDNGQATTQKVMAHDLALTKMVTYPQLDTKVYFVILPKTINTVN